MLSRYLLSTLFVIDPTAAAGHDGGLEECSQYNIRGLSQQQTSNGHLSHTLPYSEAESVSVRLICTYPQTCKLSHASIGDSQNSPSKFMLCCAKINPFPSIFVLSFQRYFKKFPCLKSITPTLPIWGWQVNRSVLAAVNNCIACSSFIP